MSALDNARGLMQSGVTWPEEIAALHDLIAEQFGMTPSEMRFKREGAS